MGAGYTRWFRPGGNIGFIHKPSLGCGFTKVDKTRIPYCLHVIATPVWPSKKTFFGLYDPQPVNYFAQAMVDRHTVHKFGEDLYFLQPNRIYISTEPGKDWFTDWYKNYKGLPYVSIDIETQGTWLGLNRKETKVPTVSKRQRFLDAGGSFSKPEMYFTDRNNIAITPCYNGPTCRARPVYETGGSVHFHNAVKQQPKEAWFVKDRTHNFENILQNTDENIWHAARDRRFYIKQGQGFGYIGKETMADKHLISTMRYLVAAWEEIKKEAITKLSSMLSQRNSISGILQEKKNDLSKCKHAPDFYVRSLPCWPTLVTEFVERFGGEALTSVLDGN